MNSSDHGVIPLMKMYGGGNSTTAEEVSRFQRLFPNPSWLVCSAINHGSDGCFPTNH